MKFEFSKKNIAYLVCAVISLGIAITFLVLIATFNASDHAVDYNPAIGVAGGSDRYNEVGMLIALIAGLVVFTLLIIPFVMLILDYKKTVAHVSFSVIGSIGMVLMALAIMLPMRSNGFAILTDIRNGDKDYTITQYVQDAVVTGAFENPELAGMNALMDFLISTPVAEWGYINTALPGMSSAQAAGLRGGILALQAELQPIIETESASAIRQATNEANDEYRTLLTKLIAHTIVFGGIPFWLGVGMLISGYVAKSKSEQQEATEPQTV